MGGAERSARRKRQQQLTGSKAVRSARSSAPDRTKIIIGVVVVLLIAGAVIGGVLYSNAQKNKTEGQTIAPSAAPVTPGYPVTRDGMVVVAGKPDAKVTIDVYEDFLCPFCKVFEDSNAASIEQKLTDGSLRVRYHILAILNEKSDPPGYSMDAANAGLCAADGNRFTSFHAALFADQPEEGARGYDRTQLVELGTRLGISSADFKSCVDTAKYADQIKAEEDRVTALPYLQKDFGGGQKGFGTPTVAVGERIIDTSDPKWIDQLLTSS